MKNKVIGILSIGASVYCFFSSLFLRGNIKCEDGFKNCTEIHYLLPGQSYNYVMLAASVLLVVIGYNFLGSNLRERVIWLIVVIVISTGLYTGSCLLNYHWWHGR